jgi:hypothetical protein
MIDTSKPDVSLYEANRKSLGLAYVLWLFLGLFGAHRFYLRAGRTGFWLLALHLGGWLLMGVALMSTAEVSHESYETLMGQGSFTSVTSGPGSAPLLWLGTTMRAAAWLWWLVDIVLVPGLLRRWNNRVAAGLGMRAE